ncbi:hypothetical protein [Rhizobium sp. P44RR-XXIV]|uniref:hypothetical protein n=1 Tax=Rhizobium sp. P44RR-XXIV TaxID=1921145 RepID=UPI0009849F7D|nr:hypothetical protein [Rhizobium sp. P44RR-XXIV]TIX89163.1 hypothetical protein BSK43_021375 [Rhizobium sp. P44RR-XXIV]
MSDTLMIIAATAIVIGYFGITNVFRRFAEKNRMDSLRAARALISRGDETPDEVRAFLAKEDYIGAKNSAPWIIAVLLPVLGIAAIFSKRDDQLLQAVEGAGADVSRLFTEYLNTTAKGALLRSPLACLIVLIELTFLVVILRLARLLLTNAQDGVKSVFTYLFMRLDDYHEYGFSGHPHRG